MSAPINFNTASFEELKTVLSKNKSHAVLEAREKAGGHLTIKAFRSATKMSQNAFQKLVNEGAIVYEVESSMQTPSQVTPPPSSEENSPATIGEDQSVPGATVNLGESGFQLTPAKFPFTPSGPPYIDNLGGGLMPANGDTGNPSSRPSPARTTTTEGGDPVPPEGPSSPALSGAQPLNHAGGNPGPEPPKSNDQMEALTKELAEMRARLAQKETESLDFQTKLSEAQHQLTASQGEALRFQQQLGQAQQTAEQSTQKVEQYKKIAREVEEKAKKEIGQVQSEVQQYQRQAKEFEGIADTLNKQQKALDLRVAQAQNEKKRMTQQYEREAKRVAELRDRLKDRDTYHDTLMGEETARVQELEQKWREEAVQRQALQRSIQEREEQLARTRLEYEDRVRQEEVRRAALEAQLLAVVPDPTSNMNQQTPRDRGTHSSGHGSRTSRHSRRIRRTPTNSVAARLAQMQPMQHPPAPPSQDHPPPYAPYAGGVPPYGHNPYTPYAGGVPQYGNPGGQGDPNWNMPEGYHQPRQYQGGNHFNPFPYRQRDPKLSKYDGSLSWHAYEVKLEHMANQYGWDDGTKLAKLVEALEGKALNYYGTLDEVIRGNYRLVRQKFNAHFFPREPARTARNQLSVLTQKDDEELEEFAERALRLSMDAWSDTSIETANQVAQEAFLHGVQDKEAALITMNRSPTTLDEALETLKKIIHDKRSLAGRGKAASTKVVRNVSFGDQEDSSTVRVATVANSGSGRNTNSTAMPKLEQEVKELANSVSQLIALLKEQHKSSDSPKSPQTPRAPGSPIICYKCGGRGHRRTECPTKSPGNATTQSPKPLNNNGLS